MTIAEQLDMFIKDKDNDVFIEAEGKASTLDKFFGEYNLKYKPSIGKETDGIIYLDENKNKWGLELRLYMHNRPDFVNVTQNTVYRSEYSYRVNDVQMIRELFDLGYRIGLN